MSFLDVAHPSWNDYGIPSKSVFWFGIIGWE